jgi:exosome complex exonuclease DIS3/RRP44
LGQKILVNIDRWESTSKYPEGHFTRSLGKAESKEVEQESLLLEFDVPYRPFGKAILDCLPQEGEGWKVPPKPALDVGGEVDSDAVREWAGREDLRGLDICSIDPPGEFERENFFNDPNWSNRMSRYRRCFAC